jgi:hypothetical protein
MRLSSLEMNVRGIGALLNNWFLKHPVSGRPPGASVILNKLVTGEGR